MNDEERVYALNSALLNGMQESYAWAKRLLCGQLRDRVLTPAWACEFTLVTQCIDSASDRAAAESDNGYALKQAAST